MVHATLHEQEIRQAIGVPGEGDLVVDRVAPLDAAQERCVCFVNREMTVTAGESLVRRKGCIVIAPHGSGLVGELGDSRVLEVADPRAAVAKVLELVGTLGRQQAWVDARHVAPDASISPLALVDDLVEIDEGVRIEPFCTVGPEVSIGRGSVLEAGARVYPRVSIGEDSVIGPNTVVGVDGFGFVRDETGNKRRIPHLAGVLVGSHVEIGALSLIQAGIIAPTVIEDHAKLGGYAGLGHGVRVGRGSSLVGGAAVGGSAVIGPDAWIGINSSIRNGIRVGAGALVGMDASVQHDLEDNAIARAPRPEVAVASRRRHHLDWLWHP